MSRISRRAVLSTGARGAVAVVAGGATAAVALESDPIFAAIEAHRAIRAEWEAFNDGPIGPNDDEIMDEFGDADANAACATLSIEPTTVAGVAALLAYVSDHLRQGHIWPEVQRIHGPLVDCGTLEINTIDFAARTLARLTGGQPNV